MQKKKLTYNKKSRKDISNPYHRISHKELLLNADVKMYDGEYKIISLDNGRIVVKTKKEINSNKK